MLVTLISLVASVAAALFDPYGWRESYPIYYAIYVVAVFIFTAFMCFAVYSVYNTIDWIINKDKILIDLDFITNPPTKHGRYLSAQIYNKSKHEIEQFCVMLSRVKAENKKVKFHERLTFYPFLWGAVMGDVGAKITIPKNNENKVVVDILHTDNTSGSKKFSFTFQHIGEYINAPIGTYTLILSLTGVYMERQFAIPVELKIVYGGGMNFEAIRLEKRLDPMIGLLRVFYDKKCVYEKQ